MLQYLINASAIWLLSLLVFDLFLSKETFHGYNRVYLLSTFVIGLVVPTWAIPSSTVQYSNGMGQPVAERMARVSDGIATSDTASTVMSFPYMVGMLYLTGVAIMLVLLVKEVTTLVRIYKRGDQSKDGVWTIIETGGQHSPYSAFRYVFISSTKDYTPEQLRIVLTHEEQHGHLLHFFDLLFMQLAKIVFWFHPLVYLYAERLSIVHEFQADAAVDKAPKEYGQFLIEQAILKSAPALSHSFNRSPIKKRILMLTRHSSAGSKSKTLIAVPLILVCVLCFSKNAFSDDKRVKEGNKITYRGNIIEVSETGASDTTIVVDPSTGKESIRISTIVPHPLALNSKKIYESYQIKQMGNKLGKPSNTTTGFTDKGIKEYLLTNLTKELKELEDGSYILGLDNVVIDENGRLVYFEYSGLASTAQYDKVKPIKVPQAQQDAIAKKIAELLHTAPKHMAATVNGEYVPSIVQNTDFWNPFTVKNGKLTAL